MVLAKRIIPCLDVTGGRVVKGVNFVHLRDAGDPVEQALVYDREEADELVFLDITASSDYRDIMADVVRRTAETLSIPFTVGGGLRGLEDIKAILRAGADKISVNTAAVQNPTLVAEGAERFGSQCIVVAIDAKRRGTGNGSKTRRGGQQATGMSRDDLPVTSGSGPEQASSEGDSSFAIRHSSSPAGAGGWEVYTHGGRVPTGLDAIEWALRVEGLGAGEILLTSMDRDGTKVGYDIPLTRAVAEAVSVPVIASGGAGTLEHLREALVEGRADAVLAASIFHFREISIGEAKDYLRDHGVPVRSDH